MGRRSSAFARRIALPENHDPKEIAARAQDGVVSIVIKKKPEEEQISKRREIPVEGQALSSPSGAQQEGEQAVPGDDDVKADHSIREVQVLHRFMCNLCEE